MKSEKDRYIESLEREINKAHEKLDQIGAPKLSAYNIPLTLHARLEHLVYVEPKIGKS